jgi:iron complex outermembrane receptor protein
LTIFSVQIIWAQHCNHEYQIVILDKENNQPVSSVHIKIRGDFDVYVSDDNGLVTIDHQCESEIQIQISHLLYQNKNLRLSPTQNDTILLTPKSEFLESITLSEKQAHHFEEQKTLSKLEITENSSKSLADQLSKINGVRNQKNGSSVGKPVVSGLRANRLSLIQQGIPHQGQRWGSDHSPAIETAQIDELKVVSGIESVQYFGSHLGDVLIAGNKAITDTSTRLKTVFQPYIESNGRHWGSLLSFEKKSKGLFWKIYGGVKQNGDFSSANYFLKNTGQKTKSFGFQINNSISKKWHFQWNNSYYETELGVLRGAHIDNLTDLQLAYSREIPFYTEEDFSTKIDHPKQWVRHLLSSLKSKYHITENLHLDFQLGIQSNKRKEFDIRRSNFHDRASLSLLQETRFLQAKIDYLSKNSWKHKGGISLEQIGNQNIPETDILPLIPNYSSNNFGLFYLISKNYKNHKWTGGFQTNYSKQHVLSISQTLPREILEFNTKDISSKIGLDWEYFFNENIHQNIQTLYSERAPAINERYSNGLHQGISGIEEGNPDLKNEKSWLANYQLFFEFDERWQWNNELKYRHIQDYIFLQPTHENRLTIRGSFPVFKYQQIPARIFSFNSEIQFLLNKKNRFNLRYNYLRGDDLRDHSALNQMPANQIEIGYQWQTKEHWWIFHSLRLDYRISHTFKQNHFDLTKELISPPEAYTLHRLKLKTHIPFQKMKIEALLGIENIWNTQYRDYLNKHRYFADDLGRNISLQLRFVF